jgi:Rps23 Pro-64 3,4-dihydroxylase Tpa1-like proline 4-hydroxylase
MKDLINRYYFDNVPALKHSFDTALPYRHLVMDDFLEPEFAQALNEKFPSVEQLSIHWKGLNENKYEGSDYTKFAIEFQQLRDRLMSPDFYSLLSDITGIKDVFITEDSLGSGIHQGENGSFLDIHIDFNIHTKLDVHRRINLLIYLEKDWKDEYGGHLELWNADMTKCEKKVLPKFNRCVIFETSEISYHGYGKITVPPHVTRKSFFAYLYTVERENAAPYHDTVFRARPEEGTAKHIKTSIKETLKNTAKATLRKLGIKL